MSAPGHVKCPDYPSQPFNFWLPQPFDLWFPPHYSDQSSAILLPHLFLSGGGDLFPLRQRRRRRSLPPPAAATAAISSPSGGGDLFPLRLRYLEQSFRMAKRKPASRSSAESAPKRRKRGDASRSEKSSKTEEKQTRQTKSSQKKKPIKETKKRTRLYTRCSVKYIHDMLNTIDYDIWPDGWTAVTKDRRRTAQFEHTILVTEDGHEILTVP
jgi:hypothetical protein